MSHNSPTTFKTITFVFKDSETVTAGNLDPPLTFFFFAGGLAFSADRFLFAAGSSSVSSSTCVHHLDHPRFSNYFAQTTLHHCGTLLY